MANTQYTEALNYMGSILDEHRDPRTGQVNMTHLAADVCQHLNLWDSNDDIPDWLFELAYDLTPEDE